MSPITTTFFSTLNREQTKDCLKFLLFPWHWRKYQKGNSIEKAENSFKRKFGYKHCLSFYNGRAALFYALKAAGVGKGDEVIIQAFTCVSVPNAVLMCEATPVYSDIDDSLNIDPNDLKKKLTERTKAVIIQHTFGNPARIDEIKEICQQKKIFLIEDCAHSLGATYKGKPVGSYGDLAMFSFGRDKVISSVNGGMLCFNDDSFLERIKDNYQLLKYPSSKLIVKNLMYPLIAATAKKWYNIFGKFIMFFSKRLKLFPLVLTKNEKDFSLLKKESVRYYRMPNILAYLFLKEFKKLEEYNSHRKKIADFYSKELSSRDISINENSFPVYLRYSILIDHSNEIIKRGKNKKIYFGNWYHNVIDPNGVNLDAIGYKKGMCPKAEDYASKVINLPNHAGVTIEDARRVAEVIENLLTF